MNIKKYVNAKNALEKSGSGPTTFAILLRTHRLAEEMSLAQMSELLQISISHLSDIEHGRKFVSIERAKEFAQRLGDSERYFVLIALRDLLKRANCNYEIDLKAV